MLCSASESRRSRKARKKSCGVVPGLRVRATRPNGARVDILFVRVGRSEPRISKIPGTAGAHLQRVREKDRWLTGEVILPPQWCGPGGQTELSVDSESPAAGHHRKFR